MSKNILPLFAIISLVMGSSNMSHAQIFPDRHTTNAFDGWISCEQSANPNTARGNSHWIMYQFNSLQSLYDLTIWNLNHPDYIKDGLNQVIIDYSSNGTSWNTLDTFTFPKAPASGFYEGFHGPDLGGIAARYLLITALSNHGGGCYGLSEVRMYTTDVETTELEFDFIACENDGIQHNLTGGVAMGGTYSGIGVTDNGDETFNFDVDKVGPGMHEISYQGLSGHIKVLPCTDLVCQECKACNVTEVLDLAGQSLSTDIHNGYQIMSRGKVPGNQNVAFNINESASLQPGFEVVGSSNFNIDFRTCYDNILQNSGFENGDTPWRLSVHDLASANLSIDNSNPYEGNASAKVVVTGTNGDSWRIQLSQRNQTIIAGKKYRISFAARSNVDSSPMSVNMQLDEAPWSVPADQNFVLSSNWETYAHEFVSDVTINNNVSVKALFGKTPNRTFWIDNFKFIQLD